MRTSRDPSVIFAVSAAAVYMCPPMAREQCGRNGSVICYYLQRGRVSDVSLDDVEIPPDVSQTLAGGRIADESDDAISFRE